MALRNQIPLNSPEGRKITSILLVVCILFCLFGLYHSREFDRQVEAGELVELQATVERITITGKGKDAEYDVRVSYTYQGQDYENVELRWYTPEMEEGQPTTIHIHRDDPGAPVVNSVRLFRIVFYALPGAVLLSWLLARFPRKKET